MIRWFTSILILIGTASYGAVWEDQSITIIGSAPSTEASIIRYTMIDAQNRSFDVHYQSLPNKETVTRILKFKDTAYSWEQIKVSQLEFFIRNDSIFVSMNVNLISYKGKDLKKNLPAGLAFDITTNGIQYRFRTIIEESSLRPKGSFTDEESFLRDISSIIEKKSEEIQIESVSGKQPPLLVNLKARGVFLIPTGFLQERFKYGYGGTLAVSLRNLGISYQNKSLFLLEISVSSGIWTMEPKPANPLTDVTNVTAYIIPLYLSLNCPINLPNNFAVIPSISAGGNLNRLSYTNLQGKKVQASAFLPSFMAELNIEYTRWNVPFHIGGGYLMMIERSRNLGMYSFSAGAGYVF